MNIEIARMNIEIAREIQSSGNWSEVCGELDLWIQSEVSKLKFCVPEQLEGIQKTIAILEQVKNLPQVVIDREQ